MTSGELLIWASDGVWYQYRDTATHQVKTSFLGFCDSFEGVNEFAESHGIPLETFPRQHPAARAAKAQTAGTSGHPLRPGMSVRGKAPVYST